MREILFRGKTTKSEEWIYGGYFNAEYCDGKGLQDFIKINGAGFLSVNHKTVGQFTGLTDKNGVKIFEHDLVQIEHPCWHAKCEVKFIDGAFFFCELDNPVQNAWIRQDKFMKEEWKIKVIGNIHDDEVQKW